MKKLCGNWARWETIKTLTEALKCPVAITFSQEPLSRVPVHVAKVPNSYASERTEKNGSLCFENSFEGFHLYDQNQ